MTWQEQFDNKFEAYQVGEYGDAEGYLNDKIKDFISNLITQERKAERERVIEALRLERTPQSILAHQVAEEVARRLKQIGYNQAVQAFEERIAKLNEDDKPDSSGHSIDVNGNGVVA